MIDALSGRRVLLIEDEYFLVDELVREFEARGAEIVGPVGSVAEALELIAGTDRIDAATLDLSLRGGELAYPVADALSARAVPFVITTGYGEASITRGYAALTRCEKPVSPTKVAETLARELASGIPAD